MPDLDEYSKKLRELSSVLDDPLRLMEEESRRQLKVAETGATAWCYRRYGGPNGIRTRVSVTITFSPAVSHGSCPHAASESDATKTCSAMFPETFLTRPLVQIGGPQPLAGKQVTGVPV